MSTDKKILCLFDVDGTLTEPRLVSEILPFFLFFLVLYVATHVIKYHFILLFTSVCVMKVILPEMRNFLEELKSVATVGVVGGSDFEKQKEQLGDDVLDFVDYSFSENGLIAFHKGQSMGSTSIQAFLGEESLKRLINWTLVYIAGLDIPVKRFVFIFCLFVCLFVLLVLLYT